ncbi:DUF4309 domain-containing protein [Bacillus sp. BGMRC 2118]|nr:DUF4309 domain-containing protein [Bacillus sp. BGMRC 2118]
MNYNKEHEIKKALENSKMARMNFTSEHRNNVFHRIEKEQKGKALIGRIFSKMSIVVPALFLVGLTVVIVFNQEEGTTRSEGQTNQTMDPNSSPEHDPSNKETQTPNKVDEIDENLEGKVDIPKKTKEEDQTNETTSWTKLAEQGSLKGIQVKIGSPVNEVISFYGEPVSKETYMEGDYYHYEDFTVIVNEDDIISDLKVDENITDLTLEEVETELGEGVVWVENTDYAAKRFMIGDYRLLLYYHPETKNTQAVWLSNEQLKNTIE